MITKAQAVAAMGSGRLEHVSKKNADGTPVRARVNGMCQTWKTRAEDFRLPCKHGLRGYFDITPRNAADWVFVS